KFPTPQAQTLRNEQDATGYAQERQNAADTRFDPDQCPQSAEAAKNAGPDPFDPAALRLSHDFAASLGVKKALLTVPVRKPDKSWFIRVHPDESYRLQTATIELNQDGSGKVYLVAPALWPKLATEATFSPRLFVTAINRQGAVFLWPLRLPKSDGKIDEWSRTALVAANLAT